MSQEERRLEELKHQVVLRVGAAEPREGLLAQEEEDGEENAEVHAPEHVAEVDQTGQGGVPQLDGSVQLCVGKHPPQQPTVARARDEHCEVII